MQVYILLSCNRCKWWRKCKGTTEELKDLVEHKPCLNCHGPRKFKCPKCSNIIKSRRVTQEDPPELQSAPAPVAAAPAPPPPEQPKPTSPQPLEAKPSPKEVAEMLGRLLARRLRGES